MSMMRSAGRKVFAVLVLSTLASSVTSFQRSSSFAGRTASVCSRVELTTELRCPPSTSTWNSARRGSTLCMPPFLKKLGLKKPEKPIFGFLRRNKNEDDSASGTTAVAEIPAEVATATEEVKTTTLQTSQVSTTSADKVNGDTDETCIVPGEEKEETETEKLLRQVKEAGTAGVVSYALWELAFWLVSIPICVFGYYEVAGHWPDFNNQEDMAKLGAEAFAFVNFARIAVPLRIGLALGSTPWVQANIIDRFFPKEELPICEPEEAVEIQK